MSHEVPASDQAVDAVPWTADSLGLGAWACWPVTRRPRVVRGGRFGEVKRSATEQDGTSCGRRLETKMFEDLEQHGDAEWKSRTTPSGESRWVVIFLCINYASLEF